MSRFSSHFAFEFFRRWKAKTCGATAIEYSLIAAGIAVAISAIVFTLGETVFTDLYSDLVDLITSGE